MALRGMRRISFPPLFPARSVANRTLPVTLQPTAPDTSPRPLPVRGGFVATRPASARVIDADGTQPGRSYLGRTADDLDSGPVPDRINRDTHAQNAGTIGTFMGGWPYDGNALFIGHQMIPRRPITVTAFSRTIDTGVTVPSLPIGGNVL